MKSLGRLGLHAPDNTLSVRGMLIPFCAKAPMTTKRTDMGRK